MIRFSFLCLLICFVAVKCHHYISGSSIESHVTENFPVDLCYAPCPSYYILSLNNSNSGRTVYGQAIIHNWTTPPKLPSVNLNFHEGKGSITRVQSFNVSGNYSVIKAAVGFGPFQLSGIVSSVCTISDLALTTDNFIYLKEASVQCKVRIWNFSSKFSNLNPGSETMQVVLDMSRKSEEEMETLLRIKMEIEITCYLSLTLKTLPFEDDNFLNPDFFTRSNTTMDNLNTEIISYCETIRFFRKAKK